MNQFSEHPVDGESAGLEPLPLEFDFQSHRMDQAIGRIAQRDRMAVPTGLNNRVFSASAKLLPQRQTVATSAESSWMNFRSFRAMFAHMNAGRVAMAAMVLMAFGIGALMMHSSGVKTSGDGMMARSGAGADRSRSTDVAANPSTQVADWEIAAVTANSTPGSVDEVNDKVAYLLEADSLTTPDEVRMDMAQLLASLE